MKATYLTSLLSGPVVAEVVTGDELKQIVTSALASALVILIHSVIDHVRKKATTPRRRAPRKTTDKK